MLLCICEKFKASILFHNPPFGYESGLDILPLSVFRRKEPLNYF
nr:MAG TPA: hypothetical protein [Caudoviricetes sp.]